jgi:hypothetical protein
MAEWYARLWNIGGMFGDVGVQGKIVGEKLRCRIDLKMWG